MIEQFEKSIRTIPDFPKKGIMFKDITTLLKDGDLFLKAVDYMYQPFKNVDIDVIAGIESRGFIFGAAMAYKLSKSFVPVRKPGKLPAEVISETYDLEYGTDSIEIHRDSIQPGMNVLVVDDLLATGGTALATCKLVERLKGNVCGISFLIDKID